MMISNREQLLLLWRCLGCGVWLDLSWVLLDRLRRCIRPKFLRFLFDIVAVVISGGGVFLFSLAVNAGEIRFVMLLATATGMWICHLSAGRFFSAVLDVLYRRMGDAQRLCNRLRRKVADLWRKNRKKVELFYKKHLQSRHT